MGVWEGTIATRVKQVSCLVDPKLAGMALQNAYSHEKVSREKTKQRRWESRASAIAPVLRNVGK